MPKERPSKKRKKTQHDKFVGLARESGADESEASFVAKVKAISSSKSRVKGSQMSTWYYFRLFPKEGHGILQMNSGFFRTRHEAEAGLDIAGVHLKSPMDYLLFEVRFSPDVDKVVGKGEIPRI
jgi:hypothetical protein